MEMIGLWDVIELISWFGDCRCNGFVGIVYLRYVSLRFMVHERHK